MIVYVKYIIINSSLPFKCQEGVKKVHEGKSTFKCHMCSGRFHEKKKPFQCKICNTAFTQYVSLKRHDARFHEWKKSSVNVTCVVLLLLIELFWRNTLTQFMKEKSHFNVKIAKLRSHERLTLKFHEGKKPFKWLVIDVSTPRFKVQPQPTKFSTTDPTNVTVRKNYFDINTYLIQQGCLYPLVEIKALIMLEHLDEQVSEPFKIETDFKFVLWCHTMRQKRHWIRFKIFHFQPFFKFELSKSFFA